MPVISRAFSRRLLATLVLIALPLAPLSAQIRFDAAPVLDLGYRYSGSGSDAIGLVDMNEDGRLDLVTVNTCFVAGCERTGLVSVRLGDGVGGFAAHFAVETDFLPWESSRALVLADFDVDGHADVAVASPNGHRVYSFRGDGAGRLLAPSIAPVSGPTDLVAGDFDGDGILDLVSTSRFNGIRILTGDGAGGFIESGFVSFEDETGFPVAADFDGDGNLDVAVGVHLDCIDYEDPCEDFDVSVLYGDGDGGFPSLARFPVTGPVGGLVGIDDDGDGDLDLAVGRDGSTPGSFSILRNGGSRAFTLVDGPVVGSIPRPRNAFDADGDGRIDLAVATSGGTATATCVILLAEEGGGFAAPHPFLAGGGLACGDVTGDGRPDIVARHAVSVSVHEGDGLGNFVGDAASVPGEARPIVVGAADFLEDGVPDLAAGAEFRFTALWSGDGVGGFARLPRVDTAIPDFAAADFDEDGHLDLLVVHSDGVMGVARGDGRGNFTAASRLGGGLKRSFAIGDFNEDGHVDVAGPDAMSPRNRVVLLIGRGDATFEAPRFTPAELASQGIVAGDFDGNGHLDVAMVSAGGGQFFEVQKLSIFLGDGLGEFGPAVASIPLEAPARKPVVADFDEDGHLDVAFTDWAYDILPGNVIVTTDGGVTVFPGNGDGTMRPPLRFLLGRECDGLVAGDFDGDDHADLAAVSDAIGGVAILRGDGAGGFASSAFRTVGSRRRGVAAADFDRDGDLDLAVATEFPGGVAILHNEAIVRHLDCRRGNVNVGEGPVTDVVFVNGSAGEGPRRRVVLDRTQPFELRVEAPPSYALGPANFVLWDWWQVPGPSTVASLPRDLGFIAMPTPLTPARSPQPRRIANNLGHDRRLGAERWYGPATRPAPTVLVSAPRLPRAATFYLQGLILDAAGPNGVAAVTNGVEVVVR